MKLYGGGGPTGTLGAFRRDAGLMLLTVEWDPSSDADCPDDQAISACALNPEQKNSRFLFRSLCSDFPLRLERPKACFLVKSLSFIYDDL